MCICMFEFCMSGAGNVCLFRKFLCQRKVPVYGFWFLLFSFLFHSLFFSIFRVLLHSIAGSHRNTHINAKCWSKNYFHICMLLCLHSPHPNTLQKLFSTNFCLDFSTTKFFWMLNSASFVFCLYFLYFCACDFFVGFFYCTALVCCLICVCMGKCIAFLVLSLPLWICFAFFLYISFLLLMLCIRQ